MRGRTSVTIAHRMSTAENADEVVVVDRGRIVQRGPHAELVAEGGVYAGLHASWVAQQALTTHFGILGRGDHPSTPTDRRAPQARRRRPGRRRSSSSTTPARC